MKNYFIRFIPIISSVAVIFALSGCNSGSGGGGVIS